MSEHDRRVDYIELPGADLVATRAFYEAVFGWAFTDYGPNYTSFEDGRMTGGFDATREVAPGNVGALIVLFADDLEACLDAVTAHNGTITRPIFSFPGGRRFHFLDPSGNELAVWSHEAS